MTNDEQKLNWRFWFQQYCRRTCCTLPKSGFASKEAGLSCRRYFVIDFDQNGVATFTLD